MLGSMAMTLGMGLVAAAELHWTAPEGCPSQAAVAETLQALVGDDVLHVDVVADAQVHRRGDEWVLQLSLRAADRSVMRQMVADECRTLADAVALVVATFADPVSTSAHVNGRSRAAAAPREPDLRAVPPPPPRALRARADAVPLAPRPIVAGRRDPRGRPPDHWGLRLGATAGRATQADLDLGPHMVLSWQRGLARVAVGALALVPRREPVPRVDGARLQQWMLAGGLEGGVAMPLWRRVELLLALGLELGPVVARGQGIARPRTVVSPWLAALGTAQLCWRPTPRWGIWAGVVGVAGVLLPRFTVAGEGPLVAGPGGLRGTVGVEWRWGGITTSPRGGHEGR